MAVDVTGYLSVAQFRVRTVMPQLSVDELEIREPDFLQTRLNDWSAWIDSRLRKRYAAPFVAPYPVVLLHWLTVLVTLDAYGKLGWQPSGESDKVSVVDPAVEAKADIKEAADAKDGLFDLPLRSDTTAEGVSKGAPLFYSETSPYRCADLQAETGREEDYL
jgi:hypothetical protein